MPAYAVLDTELCLLLHGFQTRHPDQTEQFLTAVTPILMRMARQNFTDLPSEIQEEVVQETFILLLKPDLVRFDATRGTARKYLRGFVWNAAKKVRASYGKRFRGSKEAESAPATVMPKMISFDEESEEGRIQSAEHSLDNKIEAHQLLKKAPPDLRHVFERIYLMEESLTHIAADLGVDRFRLHRDIAAFARNISATRLCA